jgi:methylated-DNA-[protein]-cysteine S-methyltransferase
VLVVVPCHRIVASNGALTGYAGGLSIKKALLAVERGQFALDADLTTGAS